MHVPRWRIGLVSNAGIIQTAPTPATCSDFCPAGQLTGLRREFLNRNQERKNPNSPKSIARYRLRKLKNLQKICRVKMEQIARILTRNSGRFGRMTPSQTTHSQARRHPAVDTFLKAK